MSFELFIRCIAMLSLVLVRMTDTCKNKVVIQIFAKNKSWKVAEIA